MPLFSYVVTYKSGTHVAQGSHSNFTGFAQTWASNIPAGSIPELTPALRKELTQRAYQGEFAALPNAKHVWRKSLDVGGAVLTVVAVQTQQ